MRCKQIIMLVMVMGIMAGCKKESVIKKPTDTTKIEVKVKDTIYLVNKMVTNQLLTPSPVTQTETFTYNSSGQVTKHSVAYKSYTQSYTTNYAVLYNDGKVSEVQRSGGKHNIWDKLVFSYSGNDIKVLYVYPTSESSIVITVNSKGLPEKVQGNGQFYMFKYDDSGNIINRSQYENVNPTRATVVNNYTYDKKRSPFLSQRDNNYILYLAFNDIYTHINNRINTNNLEVYNLVYNDGGYPEKMTVVHSSVAVRKVDYTYTTIIKTK